MGTLDEVLLLRESGEFDEAWYIEHNPDIAVAGIDPIGHYLDAGAQEGRNPSRYFDSQGYLEAYPDVRRAGMNPLVHYLRRGRAEGRTRGEPFDERFYLGANPDVHDAVAAGAFASGYDHWSRHGRAEGRASTRPPTFTFSSHPRVSIAMPVFDGGHYFKLALASAVAQLYDNTEIIVVDDGSTDHDQVPAIAAQFPSANIKYVRQDNKGVAAALNTAVDNMSGDFFSWLSHDDLFLPEKTSAQVEFYQRLGRENTVLFSSYDIIDADGCLVSHVNIDAAQLRRNPLLALHHAWINGCTVFMPLSLLRKSGQFDEGLRYTQDYEFWNRMVDHCEFVLQPRRLVKYRVHPGQGTRSPEAAIEGDRLWVRILDSRSETQRGYLFGSAQRYFEHMGSFLETTPYKRAAMYARERSRRALADSLVSAVIPAVGGGASLTETAKTLLAQTHPKLELVVVAGGAPGCLAEVAELRRWHPYVRYVTLPGGALSAAWNVGMRASAGDYIALLRPSDHLEPDVIHTRLAAMQANGYLISETPRSLPFGATGPNLGGLFARCTGTPLMIHRSVVDAGFEFPPDFGGAFEAHSPVALSARSETDQ